MDTTQLDTLIRQIHSSGRQMVLAVTGGGSAAISRMLGVPGGSKTILDAVVPYSESAMSRFLCGAPASACSERTARALAMAALMRARELSDADWHSLVGVGATASLVSDRPKKGDHRIHIAWQSAETTVVASCVFAKGRRDRNEEEDVASRLVISAIAEACGLESVLHDPAIDEPITRTIQHAPEAWTDLLTGERASVSIPPQTQSPGILFPGAFNPLHDGHRAMAQYAEQKLGGPVCYELSIANVDKLPLDFVEIVLRAEQFDSTPLLLTCAPTFAEKAALVPGMHVCCGGRYGRADRSLAIL